MVCISHSYRWLKPPAIRRFPFREVRQIFYGKLFGLSLIYIENRGIGNQECADKITEQMPAT